MTPPGSLHRPEAADSLKDSDDLFRKLPGEQLITRIPLPDGKEPSFRRIFELLSIDSVDREDEK